MSYQTRAPFTEQSGHIASSPADTLAESVPVRDFYFRQAPRFSVFDDRAYVVDVEPNVRPSLVSMHDDRDFASGPVLLVDHVLVPGRQQVIASGFGLPEQAAVLEVVPSDLPCKRYLKSAKNAGRGVWGTAVE